MMTNYELTTKLRSASHPSHRPLLRLAVAECHVLHFKVVTPLNIGNARHIQTILRHIHRSMH